MKNKKILVGMMGVVLTVSSVLGTGVYANTDKQPAELEQEEMMVYVDQDLLTKKVLTQKEFDQYNKALEDIQKLYETVDENTSDEAFEKICEAEDEIYKTNQNLFDKVDQYYFQVMIDEEVNELKKAGVLNDKELDQYKKANEAIEKLHETIDGDVSDEAFEKLMKEQDKIFEANKAIFDKVFDYYDKLDAEVEAISYDEMIENGEYTKEQVDELKKVDQEVEKLLSELPENASDEQWEEVQTKIDKLYDGLNF